MLFNDQKLQKSMVFNNQSQPYFKVNSNITFKDSSHHLEQAKQSKFLSTNMPNHSTEQSSYSMTINEHEIKEFTTILRLVNFYKKEAQQNQKKIMIKQRRISLMNQQKDNLIEKIQETKNKYKKTLKVVKHRRFKTQQMQKMKKEEQKQHVNALRNEIKRLKTEYSTTFRQHQQSSPASSKQSYYSAQKLKDPPLVSEHYRLPSKDKKSHRSRQRIRTQIIYVPMMIPPYQYYQNPPQNNMQSPNRLILHKKTNSELATPYYQSQNGKMTFQQKRNANEKEVRSSKKSGSSRIQKKIKDFGRQNNKMEQFTMKLSQQLQKTNKRAENEKKDNNFMKRLSLPTSRNENYSLSSRKRKRLEDSQQKMIKIQESYHPVIQNNRRFMKSSQMLQSNTRRVNEKLQDLHEQRIQSSSKEDIAYSVVKLMLSDNSTYKENIYNTSKEGEKSMVKISFNNLQDSIEQIITRPVLDKSNVNDNSQLNMQNRSLRHVQPKEFITMALYKSQEQEDEDEDLIYTIKLDTQSKISKKNASSKISTNRLQIPQDNRKALSSITERSEDKALTSKHVSQKTQQEPITQNIYIAEERQNEQQLQLLNMRATTTKNILKAGSKIIHRPKSHNLSLNNQKEIKGSLNDGNYFLK